MAARLRRLQLQLQFQLRLQLEYGSFRANDIKKHIMAPLWKVVVVGCVPGMRFGQKAKGRSTANCYGTLICIVKSSANPANFAELSA